MVKATDDYLEFSTGKKVYANNTVVGIRLGGEEAERLDVFDGSDGGIALPDADIYPYTDRLTAAECVELADAMLKKWSEFRAKWANPVGGPDRYFVLYKGTIVKDVEGKAFVLREDAKVVGTYAPSKYYGAIDNPNPIT